MVKTSSTMLALGTSLPFFDLPVVKTNETKNVFPVQSFERLKSTNLGKKPVLIMLLCAHCPFVKNIESELTNLDKDFGNDVHMLAIASNCIDTHPEDGPEYLVRQMRDNQWTFPYLLDSEQTFAKSLQAACTPDFFLFSSEITGDQKLFYRGQLDDSRPGNNISPTGVDLRNALDAVLNSRNLLIEQKPSIGCNIKWKKGLEPTWFA